MYTAIVLDEQSQKALKQWVKDEYPDSEWNVLCHHMTLHMGSNSPAEQKHLGRPFILSVDAIGHSDKAVALRVTSCSSPSSRVPYDLSAVPLPHITLLVNRSKGGKPFDSNKIIDWQAIEHPPELVLEGTMQVVV